jgi:beta-galactosidase GanA
MRNRFVKIRTIAGLSLLTLSFVALGQTPAPKLTSEDGRHALLVDGAPYLVLGAQIGNSSAWPAVLPRVWPALEALHVNTAEAPVYWEQIEPQPGSFDWADVDALIDGAREHHLHLVLLWFGTWKNGNDHYVPQWVKNDPQRFPRMINSSGAPIDDLSANASANMEADRKACSALMQHLAKIDGT